VPRRFRSADGDWIGAFRLRSTVSSRISRRNGGGGDDYSDILLKALADLALPRLLPSGFMRMSARTRGAMPPASN
jgi:hypothetical protein